MAKITEELLRDYYEIHGYSVVQIAKILECSENKINYWFKKFSISKRSISEAIYLKHNPKGDPFKFKDITTVEDGFLLGLGLGLYWGEGNKRNKSSVRLGNTDPGLILKFLEFLEAIWNIKRDKLRFGLQIFSDMKPKKALRFWQKVLEVSPSQFQKVITKPSSKPGTYKERIQHGVLTVYYNNKKLRNQICKMILNMSYLEYASNKK